jgi:hypothetical protein
MRREYCCNCDSDVIALGCIPGIGHCENSRKDSCCAEHVSGGSGNRGPTIASDPAIGQWLNVRV